MKRLSQLAWLSVILADLAFGIGSWYGRDAQLIQLVQPTTQAESDLFGDTSTTPGTPIGQPQMMIVRDQGAFLPATGENGLRYVDESYLKELGLYPLQLKTVNFFRNAMTLSFLALAALLAAWHLWQRRRTTVIPVPAR